MTLYTVQARPVVSQLDDFDFITAFWEHDEALQFITENREAGKSMLLIEENLDEYYDKSI